MKTFYITAPWLPGKVIIANGRDRLGSLMNLSITVWTEDEWNEMSKNTTTTKTEEIDFRR